MSTITKIKPIGLKKLNNTEYLNHMSRFRALVWVEEGDRPEIINLLSSTPSALGITSEQLAAFDAECLLLTDLMKESRVSDETALSLFNVTKPYVGIYRSANQQET